MIYLLMETVDLGGHPIKAFTDEVKALVACEQANAIYKKHKIRDLMAGCRYTQEQAEAYVLSCSEQFYLEEVELV